MKPTLSSSKLFAVAALVALLGSVAVLTEAAPAPFVQKEINFHDFTAGPNHLQQGGALLDLAHQSVQAAEKLRKRAPPATQTQNPPPHETTTEKPAPPHTTADPRPPATRTSAAVPPKGSTTTTTNASGASSGNGATNLPTGSGTVPPGSSTSNAPDGGGSSVPTGVSNKVFIGLGTVGGFIVFALGGLAFCRHRKKKNLASALLQQTAQFNNNNPYAKIPEPSTPKESHAMTPTKHIGTYNVVATYTPALADEIEIGLGDSVTILQEYDDGWCMGVNNSRGGVKGVFPRHCVEMGPYEGSQHGAPGGPHFPPSPSFKAATNKRMSSIPQGWNNDGGYSPQFSPTQNYPPQNSPHFPPPQNGGGGGGGGGGGYGGY
ncbi:hypothetical protein BGZ83_001995 [Gryganskiella cystojenkinii]|nr:hypothetical protein BGZ83_001995 [Gryganskiella cystojenkinii]